jgi:tetratricopeptide (TPR) repeat protein
MTVLRLVLLTACLPILLLAACTPAPGSKAAKDARSHYLLGASALAENNPTMALQEFLLAEKANSRDVDIQAGLAQAYMLKRAYDLAEKHLRKAIDLSDGDPQHYQNLGALYLTTERYDDAITAFRGAADNLLFATPERAWEGIGFANFQKRDYPAAERAYRKALEYNPRYAQGYFRLGELFYSQERVAEATAEFARAVELEPRSVAGHYWLGLSAMKIHDDVLARNSFSTVILLAPDSEQARLSKSYLKVLR